MAVAVATIICIVMIVFGGMTLSQGIIISADSTASNVDNMNIMEGEIARTDLNITRAAPMAWANYLRVTVKNNGQTKLASFDKWDMMVSYVDSGTLYSKWLPYNTGSLPINDEWQKARIGLDGPMEFFEPGILNAAEEMVALIRLNPPPQVGTNGDVTVAAPNGVYSLLPFSNLGYARLTPESENVTLATTKYFELVEAAPADGPAMIAVVDFSTNESARKLLYDSAQPSRPAKYVYPLVGVSEIPKAKWTVYYRGYVWSDGAFPQEKKDTGFNIDIIIRKADGSLRTTIATMVASAWVLPAEKNTWMTWSSFYNFPGYTVVDQNDYLEIDYYGHSMSGPDASWGLMELSMDDNSLPVSEQTRIEDK
jgi:archaellum component FlaF (FlaF/FlaG flagellin family)